MIAFEKSVGAVIFRRENNKIYYLLLKYRNGHWDFPKGHVENDEVEEETMAREVKEETGINDLKIIPGFSEKIRFFYRAKGNERERRKAENRKTMITKRVIFYLAETFQKEIKLSIEQTDYIWLEFDKALDKITYEKPKKVLKKANKFLEKS
ncbi:MAG: NUDIX domain-containing protein [Patescibacteria group bacterium]